MMEFTETLPPVSAPEIFFAFLCGISLSHHEGFMT